VLELSAQRDALVRLARAAVHDREQPASDQSGDGVEGEVLLGLAAADPSDSA
jgi:hypothetical protein